MFNHKILFSGVLAFASAVASAHEPVTLKSIVQGDFTAKVAPRMHSLADGVHYVASTPDHTAIVKYAYESGKAVDTLFSVFSARECDFKRFDGYELSPNEQQILIHTGSTPIYRHSFLANYFTFEIKRNLVKPLTEGLVRGAMFSPNSRMVSFVRENNIFLKKLDYGTESQVTTDGKYNQIINGMPDWVYEEEFAMITAMAWSPDSKHLAYIKFDETEVKEYTMQMFKGQVPSIEKNAFYPTSFSYKYPVAGEVNSSVGVYTFNVENKVTKQLDLALEQEDYIPRIAFTQDPTKLAVMTTNRNQSEFELFFANPASGVSKMILRDVNDAYVNASNVFDVRFYPDFFTFVSEKDGYRHLYQYNMAGRLMKQVTKGAWDMTEFYGYDPKTASFYLQAAKTSPLRREVYRVDRSGKMISVAAQPGINTAHFSQNFDYYQLYYTRADQPMRTSIYNRKGKEVRLLEDNKALVDKLKAQAIPMPEFFSFNAPSGYELNGYMIKPVGFQANKRYPVVMVQYSGPGSQQVKDQYKVDWTAYLAMQGYLVACVDGRGTGARGAEFERTTYMNLGLKESEDQIATAQYLATLPYVDAQNIAIWGWSFGGYNVLMSMTGSDVFKAGIAVAPVTDWRFYDSVYTERYMRTPQANEEGYKKSSVIERADHLKGEVLIITGSADDNVHPQNTYELTEVLVQHDIPFDMHVYTNRNHSIYGGNTRYHLYQKMVKFLDEKLK